MTKRNETIEAELAKMLVAHLDSTAASGPPVSGATDLTRDLGLESIQIMELVVDIEDHYDISIALERLSKAKTMGDLAGIVAAELDDL